MIYDVIACRYMCNILRKCSYQALQLWRPELWIVVLLPLLFPCNLGIHCRHKYGLKNNGDTRIWHFDFLEMAWHQPQTVIVGFNTTLARSVMDERYIYIYICIPASISIIQYDSCLTIFCTITCRYDYNWRLRVPGDDTRTPLLTN